MTDESRTRRIEAIVWTPDGREHVPVTACNLCGSAHHIEAARADRYGFTVAYRVCARCGLGFLSPRLTAAEYARFYDGVYRPLVSAYHGRRIDAETVQDEQAQYAAGLVRFLEGALSGRPRSLLDIGGSTGIVAGAVREAFESEATILDPAPDELVVAADAGMHVVQGLVEEVDLGEATFDLVLLCQTIDHLLDVAGALRAMRGWLAPGGHVFVDVLDVDFMARRRGSIEGAVKVDHPYYLRRETARAFFRQAGLEVVAERLSDDGHWGFLLREGESAVPDWEDMRPSVDAHLALVWSLRAGG